MGVFRSDEFWTGRRAVPVRLILIVSMSPPGYPWAWLCPGRARFRFAYHKPHAARALEAVVAASVLAAATGALNRFKANERRLNA
jgi:hypothetical protein